MTPSLADRLETLIAGLQANGSLTDPDVAAAFRAVPRHHFLPAVPLDEAYRDDAIVTKYAPDGSHPISSSSQPSMMAIMLEQLQVQPGQRILEIGAGTGYNAALLAQLTGPDGHVIALDLDDDIVTAAFTHLAAAGASGVKVVCADGALGYPPAAPYDRIILTVGAWDLAPAWYAQLRPGGRLLLPLEVVAGAQKSIAFIKPAAPAAAGLLFESASLRDCGFMRLRGVIASPEQFLPLGPAPGLSLVVTQPPAADPAEVYAWLRAGGPAAPTGLSVTNNQVWTSLSLWLGLHAPDLARVFAADGLAERGWVPSLLELPGRPHRTRLSGGLLSADGLCLLGRGPSPADPSSAPAADGPFELYLWSFGPCPAPVAARLSQILASWQAASRPGGADRPNGAALTLSVYDRAAQPPIGPHQVLVEKPATRLLLTWPPPA